MKKLVRNLACVGAVAALSGCMGTGTTSVTTVNNIGEIFDPNAPAWDLNSYLPDPNENTAAVTNSFQDTSFKTIFDGVRSADNKAVLTWNDKLDQVAQSYAGYLVDTGQFTHRGGASDIASRVTASGYSYQKVGENLARGQQTEEAAMTSWQNSPGHNANLLDPAFEEFGLGVSGTGQDITWVLVLADPL
ncbi:CAP domain-containing protein [Maritimibacter alexandrii]|uniref:CAP domain-containing protein n=1 Tax=Maritimibacter alexandrii TaxID=2570355 RepID=UPI001107A98C|nr:CAP domain-containing protein [Maritimibacter alexandrii]